MKLLILSLLFINPLYALAGGITQSDLVGDYTLIGNGGFLSYDLKLNADGSAELSQQTLDGSQIFCQGRYSLDSLNQNFIAVYNCDASDILTQETSLNGVTCDDLLHGVSLPVHIKSSRGSDSTLMMSLKKK